jgi:hypothetical protein
MHLTMIFVDGLGLGTKEDNPVVMARTPYIDQLLGGHFLWGENRVIQHGSCTLFSLDATLGVPGIPQSATGQTALWTGVNTAAYLGCHLRAFPNAKLKKIIEKESIFKKLADKGKKATFANAFFRDIDDILKTGNVNLSASTLSALAGGLKLRTREDLLAGKAVFQDITNEIFRRRERQAAEGKDAPEVPIVKPFQAGETLGRISLEHDFTLFEFFQTDVRGHKQELEKTLKIIETLDEFLGGYLAVAESAADSPSTDKKTALLLTSDHGNIEDLHTSTHTMNQVPALCWSNFEMEWPKLKSITEVTPAILKLLMN